MVENGKQSDDINTPAGMLRFITCMNQHGVWFVRLDGRYIQLPRWMWGHMSRAVPEPEVLSKG